MHYVICGLLGYLLGCSSMAYYISKINGFDLRQGGSKNLGASNTVIHFGWWAGFAVAFHDVGKALLAAVLAKLLFPGQPYVGAVAGVCAVLGHIFPFYLRFKGGKGTAPYIGLVMALNWKLALAVIVIMLLAALITDYIVIGTFSIITLSPIAIGLLTGDLILAAIVLVGTVVIFYRHLENIGRLRRGEEIGLRRVSRGETQIKR